ncbi:MAG: hypothetical protein H0W68_09385 [Gemmatimonadaceae bacterium]|nr:hypothetical protein [Gemmatimonadaceae bacterium]
MRTRDVGRRESDTGGGRRSGIGWYGWWQLRDYLIDRGTPTVIVSALFGYLTAAPMLASFKNQIDQLPPRLITKWGGVDGARAMLLRELTERFLLTFLGTVVFLAALFAMNGIVANDRKLGFYRFLFAKPVSPARYYGQAFLIHCVGFVVLAALLALVYGAIVFPIIGTHLMVVMAMMFLCYAGIAFCLSAAARWDWLSLVAVTVAASHFWGTYGESSNLFAKLLYLLPPLHRTAELYAAVAKGTEIPWPLLYWLAGYGVVSYLIGLIVLYYRRLAIA